MGFRVVGCDWLCVDLGLRVSDFIHTISGMAPSSLLLVDPIT